MAIINQKGGCGKTTTSINLAATLAVAGHRTLLVDMDPQGHCGLGLAVPESQLTHDVSDVLRGGGDAVAVGDAVWRVAKRLDLVPSSIRLAGIEQELSGRGDRDQRLAIALRDVESRYDFCIIDCPPSIGLLTFNALRAAGEVIVPVETGYFALQGSMRQLETVEMLARRVGHRVRFRVLATMVDVRTRLSREILAQLKEQFGERLLPLTIGFNGKLKEAAGYGQPITEYDAASRGCADFEELAMWLVNNPPSEEEWVSEGEAARAEDSQWVGDAVGLDAGGRWGQPREEGRYGSFGTGAATGTAVAVDDAATRTYADREAAPTPPPAPAPGMSRAAELVERARDLSARAAALSAKVQGGSRHGREAAGGGEDMAAEAATPGAATPGAAALEAVSPTVDREGFGVRVTERGVVFRQPGKAGREVGVAGEFTDWQPVAMQLDVERGVWEVTLDVEPGRWRYRLVIDGRWMPDASNPRSETNEFGESHSVIDVACDV